MSLSIGEIEASLKLRDDMSPQIAAAKAELQSFNTTLQATATTTTGTFVPAIEAADEALVAQTGILTTLRTTLNDVAAAEGLTFAGLGLIGSAGAVLGAGYVGWGIGRWIGDFTGLDGLIDRIAHQMTGLNEQVEGAKLDVMLKAWRDGAPAGISYAEAIAYNAERFQQLHAVMGPVLTDHEQYLRNKKAAEQAEKDATEALKHHNEELKKHQEELRKATEEHAKLLTAVQHMEQGVGVNFKTLETLGERVVMKVKTLKEEIDDLARHGMYASSTLLREGGSLDPNITGAVDYGGMMNGLPNVSPSGQMGGIGAAAGTSWVDGFGASLQKNLGPNIIRAFEGGGDLLQTIGGTVGADLGAALGGPIGSAIGGALGGSLGDLFGGIGGPSISEQLSRGSRADFMQQFTAQNTTVQGPLGQSFTQSDNGFADMIATLGPALESLGYDGEHTDQIFRHMLDANTPEEFARAIAPINAALATSASISTDVKSIVSDVTKEWSGHVLSDAMKAQIEHLATMRGLTEDERVALLNLTKDTRPDFERLLKTANDCGISLEALGPGFEQGDLEDKFKTVNQNIVDLTHAGGDLGGILRGYTPTIQGLVTESEKFGTKIPDNMKPWLQSLITAGTLTDGAGHKITDLSQLSFEGTPVDETLTHLDTTMDHLKATLDGLPHQIELAFLAAQGNPFAQWGILPPPGPMENYHLENGMWVPNAPNAPAPPYTGPPKTPGGGATGGWVTELGIQGFAAGGIAASDTVPALLTPGEMILNRSQQAALFGGDIVVESPVYIDGEVLMRLVNRYQQRDFHTRGKRGGA